MSPKANTPKNEKATLIHEWDQWDPQARAYERLRLIALGKWSPGYEDFYVVDRLSTDTMGEPSWVRVHEFTTASNTHRHLMGALKSVLFEHAQRQVKPNESGRDDE